MERRLGKGLGSLLGEAAPDTDNTELDLGRIDPNPHQPRRTIDPAGLDELAASIRNHGVLQPIVVRPRGERFELIAGERRLRAARVAGLVRIPAVVRHGVTDEDMLELALVENVQRKDLNPIERALGYRQLMERLAVTQEQVAARVGLHRATIANHLRLLELPDEVQDAVGRSVIDMGHARALLGLSSRRAKLDLLKSIVKKELSVREVERLVREQPRAGSAAQTSRPAEKAPPWARELEKRLRTALGTKVQLQGTDRGRIVIEFFSREELDQVCERLAPRELL